jgi:hypothetical protein
MSESGWPGLMDEQDFFALPLMATHPVNFIILKILIQTIFIACNFCQNQLCMK